MGTAELARSASRIKSVLSNPSASLLGVRCLVVEFAEGFLIKGSRGKLAGDVKEPCGEAHVIIKSVLVAVNVLEVGVLLVVVGHAQTMTSNLESVNFYFNLF